MTNAASARDRVATEAQPGVARPATRGTSGAGLDARRMHQVMTDLFERHPDGLCQAVSDIVLRETDLDYSFVTRFEAHEGETPKRAEIVATTGRPQDSVGHMYDLEGTPCQHVQEFCNACVPRAVVEMYPEDDDLRELGVESYAGVALTGIEGVSLGAVLGLSMRPIADPDTVMRRLGIIAQRFSFEIERRRGEKRLQLSEQRYRSLVDAMPDGLVVYQGGRIVFANPEAARLRGLDGPEQLIGHPADSENGWPVIDIASGLGVCTVGVGANARAVDCTASSVMHNGATAMQVIERDLTERRQAERRMLRVFDISPNAMAILHPDGRIRRSNHAMRRLIGADREHHPESIYEFFEKEHAAAVRGLVNRASKGGAITSIEYSLTTDAGSTRSVRWIAYADPEDGSITLGGDDTTERREAERRLLRSERENATALLTSGLAHDLGNLFNALAGHLHIARTKLSDDHAASCVFDDIEEVLAHAHELRDSLQTLGGDGASADRDVDLGALIEESRPLLERLVRGRVMLEVDVQPDAVMRMRGDAARLRQVLVNLVVNGRDATSAVGVEGGVITISAREHDGTIRLTVSDNGPGVSEDLADSIFEPFVTTRGRGSGTGLGLAICRAIVESHAGTIELDSRAGEGARFTITLPSATGDSETDPISLDGVRVMLDYPAGQEREIITSMLGRVGAIVGGEEAGAQVVILCGCHGVVQSVPCVIVLDSEEESPACDCVRLYRPFGLGDLERAVARALMGVTT